MSPSARTDIKNQGVSEIFIASGGWTDGIFQGGSRCIFPRRRSSLCVVHQVEASLNCVSWKQCKAAMAANLQPIPAEGAYFKLEASEEKMEWRLSTITRCGAGTWST